MFFITSTACLGVLMVIVLTIRQLFFGLKRDKTSKLNLPPRVLTGNNAYPIIGHTRLIRYLGNYNAYKTFHADMTCLHFLPKKYCNGKTIGTCFAIFVWAQWRVFIHGPTRCQKVFKRGKLKPSWAYFVPRPLLGMSCPSVLKKEYRELFMRLLKRPLSQEGIIKLAPKFAYVANNFIDELLDKDGHGDIHTSANIANSANTTSRGDENKNESKDKEIKNSCKGKQRKNTQEVKAELCIISPNSLKEFTLKLMDGPILGLGFWNHEEKDVDIDIDVNSKTDSDVSYDPKKKEKSSTHINQEDCPSQEKILTWIKRIQKGLLGFKFTAGGSWMQLWRCNEYGRALNARDHLLNDILLKHVSKESERTETKRDQGQLLKDSLTTSMPLVALACEASRSSGPNRDRSNSEPSIHQQFSLKTIDSDINNIQYSQSLIRQQSLMDKKKAMMNLDSPHKILRRQSYSGPNFIDKGNPIFDDDDDNNDNDKRNTDYFPASSPTLLQDILEETDEDDIGLKESVVAEVCMHLWSMLDASSSWTANALYIFQNDSNALQKIKDELDGILWIYGHEGLFSPRALSEMYYLDAIIYEAIRLCPQFCGGLWQSTKTVNLKKDGLHIPAGTHILFSDASAHAFDLESAWGKSPQDLGKTYPSEELYGFLPFSGLEVPLLVLQTKVLLITIILRCDIISQECKDDNDIESIAKIHTLKQESVKSNEFESRHSSRKNLGDNDDDISFDDYDDDDDDDISYEKSQSELESQLSQRRPVSLMTPSSANGTGTGINKHQVDNTNTLSPDTCRNWFQQMPFPEAINNVGIKRRRVVYCTGRTPVM